MSPQLSLACLTIIIICVTFPICELAPSAAEGIYIKFFFCAISEAVNDEFISRSYV